MKSKEHHYSGEIIQRYYFAGKVDKEGWRQKLFDNPRVMSDGEMEYVVDGRKIIYGGPYALSCDHGCFHWGMHALVDSLCGCGGYLGPTIDTNFSPGIQAALREVKNLEREKWFRPKEAVEFCLQCLDKCDEVIAYIDTTDCFGTLVELGYATSKRIPIHLFIKESLFQTLEGPLEEVMSNGVLRSGKIKDELWFIKNLPTVKTVMAGFPSLDYIPGKFAEKSGDQNA